MGSLVRCYPQQSQHCPRNGEYAYFIEGYKSDTSLKNLNPMSRRATSVVILCFAWLQFRLWRALFRFPSLIRLLN